MVMLWSVTVNHCIDVCGHAINKCPVCHVSYWSRDKWPAGWTTDQCRRAEHDDTYVRQMYFPPAAWSCVCVCDGGNTMAELFVNVVASVDHRYGSRQSDIADKDITCWWTPSYWWVCLCVCVCALVSARHIAPHCCWPLCYLLSHQQTQSCEWRHTHTHTMPCSTLYRSSNDANFVFCVRREKSAQIFFSLCKLIYIFTDKLSEASFLGFSQANWQSCLLGVRVRNMPYRRNLYVRFSYLNIPTEILLWSLMLRVSVKSKRFTNPSHHRKDSWTDCFNNLQREARFSCCSAFNYSLRLNDAFLSCDRRSLSTITNWQHAHKSFRPQPYWSFRQPLPRRL